MMTEEKRTAQVEAAYLSGRTSFTPELSPWGSIYPPKASLSETDYNAFLRLTKRPLFNPSRVWVAIHVIIGLSENEIAPSHLLWKRKILALLFLKSPTMSTDALIKLLFHAMVRDIRTREEEPETRFPFITELAEGREVDPRVLFKKLVMQGKLGSTAEYLHMVEQMQTYYPGVDFTLTLPLKKWGKDLGVLKLLHSLGLTEYSVPHLPDWKVRDRDSSKSVAL
jgi:hypothetical protein